MNTNLHPVLFIGHGSPMNALAENKYSKTLFQLAKDLPRPKAILCISAHWMTNGTFVTHMRNPKTIHDFHGFPQELFDVQYPATGLPTLAESIGEAIKSPVIQLDEQWGLDHGAWSVLKHMYPKADIPVLQLSLDIQKPSLYHFQLGEKISFLRSEGVLILGSGNIVHNLRKISWDPNAPAFDWATTFDQWVAQKLKSQDYGALVEEALTTNEGRLSIPTPEHWYPFIYALGASYKAPRTQEPSPQINKSYRTVYEGIENASISMRSVMFT